MGHRLLIGVPVTGIIVGAEGGEERYLDIGGTGLDPGVATCGATELLDVALDPALETEALHAEAAHGPVRLMRPGEERVVDRRW
jgi:hypothetical protein